jgi:tetratricopeptide (TPR) repeat protein
MTINIKYINLTNIKFILMFGFVLFLNVVFGQDPIMTIEGRAIEESGRKIEGVSVRILQNGKEVHNVTTGSNGQYQPYDAYYGYVYKIIFSKEGLVTKTVSIDSKENFYEEDVEPEIALPVDMTMISKDPNVDYSPIEKKDVAKVHIDKNTGLLDFDMVYINSRGKEIADFFEKLANDAKDKDKKFKELVKAGYKAFKEEKYADAVKNWKAAIEIQEDVDIAVKITDTKMLLDEVNAGKEIDEKFNKLIKEGDDLLASNNFDEAITKYNQAKKVKPKNYSPIEKIKAVEDKKQGLENVKVDKEYNDLMAKAEREMSAKDYTNAIGSLKQAQLLKSKERLPAQRISEINDIVANAVKNKLKYKELITQADGLFASKSYQESKYKYKEALTYFKGLRPISKIAEIDKLLEEQAKQKKETKGKVDKFESFIKQADREFQDKKYTVAKETYKKASELFPENTYPKEKIEVIEQLLKKQESDYKNLVSEGDKHMSSKNLDQAIAKYEEALEIKEKEEYPTAQIKKVNNLLGDAKKDELYAKNKKEQYDNLVDDANKHLKTQKFDLAKETYKKALELFPDENYPKTQIKAIDDIIKQNNEKNNEQYNAIIKTADEQLQNEEYELAMEIYKNALKVKEDNYPIAQIEKVKKAIEQKAQAVLDAAGKEKKYNELKLQADKELTNQNFNLAKEKYQEALTIKPNEEEPKKQIALIDDMVRKRKERFDKYIAEADDLFGGEKYEVAIEKYEEAIWVMPVEQYPKDQIELARKRLEENKNSALVDKERDAKYKQFIDKGNLNFNSENYIQAKENYTKALGVKLDEQYPKDQLALIDKKLKELEQKNVLVSENKKTYKQYRDLISNADNNFDNQNFEEAKTLYKKAYELKEEFYPQSQIEEINQKLKELTQSEDLRKQYDKIVAVADKNMIEKDYKTARDLYKRAMSFNSLDAYPPLKISEIDRIETDLLKQENLKEAEETKKNKAYYRLIKLGDNNFDAKRYQTARDNYQEALDVKPNQTYPNQKIAELDVLLTEIANEREKYQKQNSDFFDMDSEVYGEEVNMSADDVNLIITKSEDNRQARMYAKLRDYVDSLNLTQGKAIDRETNTTYLSYKDYDRIKEKIIKEQGENDYASDANYLSFELFREYHIKEKAERELNAKEKNSEISDQIDELKEDIIEEEEEGQASIEKNAKNYENLNDRLAKEKQTLELENIDKTSEIYNETTSLKEKLLKEGEEGQASIERNAANYNRLNDRFAKEKEAIKENNIDKTSKIYNETNDLKERLIQQSEDGQESIEQNVKEYEKLNDRYAEEAEERRILMDDFQGELNKDINELKERLIEESADGQLAIEQNIETYKDLNDRFAEEKQKEYENNIDKTSETYNQTTLLKEELIEQSDDGQAAIGQHAKQYEKINDRLANENAEIAKNNTNKTNEIYDQTTNLKEKLITEAYNGQAAIEKKAKDYQDFKDDLAIKMEKEADKEERKGSELAKEIDGLKEKIITENEVANLATENHAIHYENLNDRLAYERNYDAKEDINNSDRNAKNFDNIKDNLGEQKSDVNFNKLALMFPEGVTQKIYQRKNELGEVSEVTVRRIVVKGNRGNEYRKTTNKMGSIYFKNGRPISDSTWDIETSGEIVNE